MKCSCPICDAVAPIGLVHRRRVPVLQNRVWATRDGARSAPVGELDMVICQACGFAWNRAYDGDIISYDSAYDNDQSLSPHYRSHLSAMAERILQKIPSDESAHLIEIGCGQGDFIRHLAQQNKFSSAIGFDPAWRGHDGVGLHGAQIFRRYFDSTSQLPKGTMFVVARHTIEHLADPLNFLRKIRKTMSIGGRLFLETPDIDWILETRQAQDLFYEHCSIFSSDAMHIALAKTGFEPMLIERVFNGQYIWVEARPTSCAIAAEPRSQCSPTITFAKRLNSVTRQWKRGVRSLAAFQPVWLWGAASKGVTFALIVDPDGSCLAGAIDINKKKIAHFMPVTGLPIVAPANVTTGAAIIVMNPNYRDEIASHIDAMHVSARLLTIDDLERIPVT